MKRKNTKTPEQIALMLAEIVETQWEEFHRADKEPRSKYEWGELRKAYAFGFIKAIQLISARGKGVKCEPMAGTKSAKYGPLTPPEG